MSTDSKKFAVGDKVIVTAPSRFEGFEGRLEGSSRTTAIVRITKSRSELNPVGSIIRPYIDNLELMEEPVVPVGEVRTVSTTGGAKGTKPERFELIPVPALTQLARMYARGAEKYSETCAEPNWRKGYEWSKSYAAMQRHANQFWSGEDIDEETQLPHMAAVAFHAFALLTFMEEHREFDDRFKGATQSQSNN